MAPKVFEISAKDARHFVRNIAAKFHFRAVLGDLAGFRQLKAALDVVVEAQQALATTARRHCCYSERACWQTNLGDT
jgi:hypothetical protein